LIITILFIKKKGSYLHAGLTDVSIVDNESSNKYFVSAGGNLITDNESKGYLISYTSKKKDDETESTPAVYEETCTVISSNIGYYLNGDSATRTDYPLLKCESDGCTLTEKPEGADNDTPVYYINAEYDKDSLINTENKYYALIKCGSSCDKEEPAPGNINVNGPKFIFINEGLSLISCVANYVLGRTPAGINENQYTCSIISAEQGYYSSKDVGGDLIKCGEVECSLYSGHNGNYINQLKTDEIISCEDNCNVTPGVQENVNGAKLPAYYVDSSKGGLGLIYCTTSACTSVSGINRGVYIGKRNLILSGDLDIIKCISDSCAPITIGHESVVNPNPKYYINGSDEDRKTKPLIEGYTDGTNYGFRTIAASEKTIYMNSNRGSNLENNLIYCSSATSCQEITPNDGDKFIQIVKNDEIKKIVCTSSGCPSQPTEITAAEMKQNVAYYLDPSSGRVLEDNNIPGNLLVCSYTEATQSGDPASYSCEYKSSSSLNNYYVNGFDNTLIIKNDDGSLTLTNSMDPGYYINSSNSIIVCYNGKCKVNTAENCNTATSNKWGTMDPAGKLCIANGDSASKAVSLPSGNKINKYIINIQSPVITNGSGSLSNGYYLFKAEAKKVTIPTRKVAENFVVDTSSYQLQTTTTSGYLFNCAVEGTCTKSAITFTEDKYYLNSDSDTAAFPNIKCTSGGTNCSLARADTNDVYCVKGGKLNVCQKDCSTGCRDQIAIASTVEPIRYYLSTINNNKLIKCTTDTSCTEITPSGVGYYLSQDLSKPLIRCIVSMGSEYRCYYETINTGLYIAASGQPIYCNSNNACNGVDPGESGSWYVSGETGMVITYCKRSGCTAFPTPELGYYVNGYKDDGKVLISCTSKNNAITCAETAVNYLGYYLNSDKINRSDPDIPEPLIKCDKTGCSTESTSATKNKAYYYINGQNRHLIMCNDKDNCVPVTVNTKGWYLSENYEMIGCSKNGNIYICTQYDQEHLPPKGYYINSDSNTSNAPLIINDGTPGTPDISDDNLENGWYINEDPANEASDKIIRCTSSKSCTTKEIKNKSCSTSLNGEFTTYYGANDIRYCNGNEAVALTDGTKKFITFTVSDMIPGVILPDKTSSAIAIIKITNNYGIKITHEKINGYTIDNDTLYFCNGSTCNKITDPVDGYYIDQTNEVAYQCIGGICKIPDVDEPGTNLCDDKSIIKYEGYKLCTKKQNNAILLKDIKVEMLYAIENNLDEAFGITNRYVRVNVDKYSIRINAVINEISSATIVRKDESKSADVVQLQALDKKIYKLKTLENLPTSPEGTTFQISANNVLKDFEYDYYTNSGYFIYGINSDKHVLKEVYIDNGDDYKYYCKIGDICVLQKKSTTVPVTNFVLSEDGVLNAKNKEGTESVYTNKIMKGSYMINSDEMAECDEKGHCKKKRLPGSIVKFTNNLLEFNNIKASKLYNKFVFFNPPKSLRKRDSENQLNVEGLIELTSASYTKTDFTTRNIFVDSNYIQISDGSEAISIGYSCINGSCLQISNSNVERYYLNTIQIGKKRNEVVKCGSSCEFIDIDNNMIFENAAATGSEDAIISCDAINGCIVTPDTTNGGLPVCKSKFNENKVYYKSEEGDSECIRADIDVKLLKGQHCIFNGDIYKTDDSGRCTTISPSNIKVFDVALREINYPSINEKHVKASMYYCKTINTKYKCNLTYGYLYNNNNPDKYALCDKFGCTMKTASTITDCTILRAGSFVRNGKFCQTSSTLASDQRSLTDTSEYYVPMEIDTNGIFPETIYGDKVIVGVNNNAAYLIIDDGYVILKSSSGGNTIIRNNDVDTSNNLYLCSSLNKNCVGVSGIQPGLYYSSFSINPIKCDNTCKLDGTYGNTNDGYLINSIKVSFSEETKYKYVESQFPGFTDIPVLVACTAYKMTVLKTDGYILLHNNNLAENGNTSTDLYLCNSNVSSCILKDISKREIKAGWYVNGGGNTMAIKCEEVSTSYKCFVVNGDLGKSCTSEGAFIYTQSSYQFCYESNKAISLSSADGNAYQLTSSNNGFPSQKDYVIVSKYAVQGIGSTLKGGTKFNGLPKCKSYGATTKCTINEYDNNTNKFVVKNLEVDQYCYNGDAIYRTNIYGRCEKQYAKETGRVFLFNYFTAVNATTTDATNVPTDGTQMFYCKDGSCRAAAGYYKLGSYWYRCDGVGCNKDFVRSPENGNLDASYKLNCGRGNGKANSGSHTYYYIIGNNKFPGAESNKGIMVETGEDYFVNFKGEGYYLIDGTSNEMLVEDTYVSQSASRRHINQRDLEKRVSSNNLFLCESATGDCNKQGNDIHGYFINAGAKASNLAIIGCYGREGCKLADNTDIGFGLNKCDETYIGRVIRLNSSANTNYKICIGKSTTQDLKTSANTVKYYEMILDNGANFAGIEIEKKEDNANVTARIIIRIDNRSITQYTGEGYILFSNNDIPSTVNASGTLNYCEDKTFLKNDATTTVQCNTVTTINNGWYKTNLGDQRYIRCQDKQCKIQEALISDVCKYSGQLIFADNTLKLCQTIDKQVKLENVTEYKAIMNVSYYNEFPGVRLNNTEIIVTVSKEFVTTLKLDSYMVVQSDNTIIDEEGVPGSLYKCTAADGACVKDIIPNNNYYIKTDIYGNPIDLIQCKDELYSPCSVFKSQSKVKEGFYVSASIEKPIIQCIQPGSEIEGAMVFDEEKDFIQCVERDYKEGWFLNAAKEVEGQESNPSLIHCDSEEGCIERSNDNGWYVNLGADKLYDISKYSNATVYPFISCNQSGCQYYDSITNPITKDCAAGGGHLIISNNQYKLCRDEKTSNSVDFTNLSSNSYSIQVVYVANTNDFPDIAGETTILAEVRNNYISNIKNDGYYYKDSKLYKCEITGSCDIVVSGGYYFEELNRQIIFGSCKENSCTWTYYNKEGFIFLTEDNKLVTADTTSDLSIHVFYQCKKNDSKTNVCIKLTPTKGYYYNLYAIDSTKKVTKTVIYHYDDGWSVETETQKCTYVSYKTNVCTIGYANENEVESYTNPYVEAGGFCVTDAGKYYFAIEEINTGMDKPNCIAIPSENSVGYYQINDEIYTVEKIGAYKINFSTSTQINTLDPTNVFGYAKGKSGIWRSYNQRDEYTITCENDVCSNAKTLTCEYNFQINKCKVTSGSLNPGETCLSTLHNQRFIAVEKLTNAEYGDCVTFNTKNDKTLSKFDDTINDISMDKKVYNINGKMYTIKNDSTFIEIENEGVHVIDEAHYEIESSTTKVFDVTETSYYDLFICGKEEGCQLKTSCGNNDLYEYIFDKVKENLIQCDPTTNTFTRTNAEGYYLNSANQRLVKCFNDHKCKEYNDDTGMEGYYMNAGNYDQIIVCRRTDGHFVCSEEEAIECSYSETEGTCQSDKALARNSYCYYSVEEKLIGRIRKILYIENFIKAGEVGNCLFAGVNDYYFMYDDSKFLGYEERTDLIKVSRNSITTIYEKDIGYYIINTKDGLGITENKIKLKKTRLYECTSAGCVENRTPKNNEIYVNKASSEKLVQFKKENIYSISEWNIIKHGCEIDENNPAVCNLGTSNDEIDGNELIYIEKNDELTIYGLRIGIKGRTPIDYHDNLEGKTYYKSPSDDYLYYFNENMQSLSALSDRGYYFLSRMTDNDNSDNYNLIPYRLTVNETEYNKMIVYTSYGGNDYSENIMKNGKGYYWNRADIDGEGLAMQYMYVPLKERIEIPVSTTKRSDSSDKPVFKAVINKCTSTKKNVCVSTEDRNINIGSACVVTDGAFKGLYLVTDKVKKDSSTVNCMRYDSGVGVSCSYSNGICKTNNSGVVVQEGGYCVSDENVIYYATKSITNNSDENNCYSINSNTLRTYQYINNRIEFAGEPISKNIIRVEETRIYPFDDNIETEDIGYYVLDENKGKFTSITQKSTSNAYQCQIKSKITDLQEEIKYYECSALTNPNQFYYYDKENDNVLYVSGNRWKVETNYGYYFFNKDHLAASIRTVNDSEEKDDESEIRLIKSSTDDYSGSYINSAATNRVIVINYSRGDTPDTSTYQFADYKTCVFNKDGTCKSANTDTFTSGDICYNATTKKLYVVEIIQSEAPSTGGEPISKIMCKTGSSSKYKYSLISDTLYRLDGLAAQEMEEGFYILDENWEEFSCTYPESAYKIIYCEDKKCEVLNSVSTNADVVINRAGNSQNWMKYYPDSVKFVNIYKDGLYAINRNEQIPASSSDENTYYTYQTSHGNEGSCGIYDICINYADPKREVMIHENAYYSNPKITYNSDLDCIEYDGEHNLDTNKNVFIYHEGYLYRLMPKRLEHVNNSPITGGGIYAIVDGKTFDSSEWTILSGNEICYYEPGNPCSTDKLNTYRKYKYVLNYAAEYENGVPSILEYDSENDQWRTVKEDGVYFFFVDNYSITAEDRRIQKAYQVMDGVVKDVTNIINSNYGIYVFNDLVVKSISKSWKDGRTIIPNVEFTTKRKCTTFEIDEILDIDDFCYGEGEGICTAKLPITNSSTENNCIFSEEIKQFYFVMNDSLYVFNKQYLQRLVTTGLYVITSEGEAYTSTIEGEAQAYLCENGKCTQKKELNTGYYVNSASISTIADILFYNNESNTWVKSKDEGIFFFNGKGYPVYANEKLSVGYVVKNEGNIIDEVESVNGIKYLSKSNPEETIVMSYTGGWKAEKIAECSMDENGNVKSKAKLVGGDLCKNDENIIMITSVKTANTRRDEDVVEEYNYLGVKSSSGETEKDNKYFYLEDSKAIVIFINESVQPVSINGIVIIDDATSLPLESENAVAATAYECKDSECLVISVDKLVTDKLYINAINKKYPLVKYTDNGNWNVETTIGYYFFDQDYVPVVNNSITYVAYEVSEVNGNLVQTDITEMRSAGFFFNKASNNNYIISNNESYWSKGEKIYNCNITEIDEGMLCKSLKEDVSYSAGQYCYQEKSKQVYLLTGDAGYESETPNCIYGINDEPTYIMSSKSGGILNGAILSNKLIKLNNDAITIAKEGYYLLDQDGHLITDNSDEGVELTIINCTDNGCSEEGDMDDYVIFRTNEGGIFKLVEGKLVEVIDDGYYFFNNDGKVSSKSSDEISEIIHVENGNMTSIALDSLAIGAYVNTGDVNSVASYDGDKWIVEEASCNYNKETATCSNDSIELNLGSYCVVEGKFYIINKVNEEKEEKYCVAGQNNSPVFINNKDNKLIKVMETVVNYIVDEGYYSINSNNSTALASENPIESKFIQCSYGGECEEVDPMQGCYLNRSPEDYNIVQFPTGNVLEAQTIDNKCTFKDNVCTTNDESKELSAGDLCIADRALYLVSDDGQCVMAENSVVTYQIINNKLYRIGQDAVVQKMDGYYFLNGQNKAITNSKDYANPDTKGYICSVKGECYELDPQGVRYFPDYITMQNNNYKVIKYDESKKTKRDGSSGYEILKEEGIIKLDDGSYTECEFGNNDEIKCGNIKEKGSYKTIDNEIIVCNENSDGEVECSQAIEGGYYVIDGELLDCEPVQDSDKLKCEEMDKEGYFLSKVDEILYECVEKEEKDTKSDEPDESISNDKREVPAEGNEVPGESGEVQGESNEVPEEGNEVQEEENEVQEEENGIPEEGNEENSNESNNSTNNTPPIPLDVTCSMVKCEIDKVISFDNEDGSVEMYICKKIETEDNDKEETKWLSNEDCESGNFVKDGDYYNCEEEKGSIDEENIEKPNTDHTANTDGTTRTKTITTAKATSIDDTTITTTSTTNTESQSSTNKETTTKKSSSKTTVTTTTSNIPATSTTKTSTSSKATSAPTTSPSSASSIFRKIPSFTYYLILFIFTYYIFI